MPASLTPTSYAILGLLAVRPWSSYELAQQMHRALGQFWPRAESRLYEEPKKLVAHGLASATVDRVGRRARTVYAITPAGSRALADWIRTPGAGPQLEFEELIKVFFAEHGSRDDLLATIQRVRDWVDETIGGWTEIARGYLRGDGPFPERLPWLILTGRFLDEHVHAVERWVDWATEVVAAWPDNLSQAEPDWQTLRDMAARVEAHLLRAAQRRHGPMNPTQPALTDARPQRAEKSHDGIASDEGRQHL